MGWNFSYTSVEILQTGILSVGKSFVDRGTVLQSTGKLAMLLDPHLWPSSRFNHLGLAFDSLQILYVHKGTGVRVPNQRKIVVSCCIL